MNKLNISKIDTYWECICFYDDNWNIIHEIEIEGGIIKKDYYDKNWHCTYSEDSKWWWTKTKHNKSGEVIYEENSDLTWKKRKYDKYWNIIYWENSDGKFIRIKDKKVVDFN